MGGRLGLAGHDIEGVKGAAGNGAGEAIDLQGEDSPNARCQ